MASGNFTSSDANMSPPGSRAQNIFESGRVIFTLSDVNMSPQGSRRQQLFSESPGGTQRTGTINLTPESGDSDKKARAKRQTGNSVTRKRILQPHAYAAANKAAKERFYMTFEWLSNNQTHATSKPQARGKESGSESGCK